MTQTWIRAGAAVLLLARDGVTTKGRIVILRHAKITMLTWLKLIVPAK
jgi:hypothetical protein